MNAPPLHRRQFVKGLLALLTLSASALRAASAKFTSHPTPDPDTGPKTVPAGDPVETTIELVAADGTVLKRGVSSLDANGNTKEISYWEHPTHPDLDDERKLLQAAPFWKVTRHPEQTPAVGQAARAA